MIELTENASLKISGSACFIESIIEPSRRAYKAQDYGQLFISVYEAKVSSGNAGFDGLFRIPVIFVSLLQNTWHEEDGIIPAAQALPQA